MDTRDFDDYQEWQDKRLEEILFSNVSPSEKVQQIIKLGFDEEDASEAVRRYQMGERMLPVYYERLNTDEDYYEDLGV